MTGEITLREGYYLSGIKGVAISRYRAGITKVIIPEENIKDLEEIPENIKEEIEIIPVENMDKVLDYALAKGGGQGNGDKKS